MCIYMRLPTKAMDTDIIYSMEEIMGPKITIPSEFMNASLMRAACKTFRNIHSMQSSLERTASLGGTLEMNAGGKLCLMVGTPQRFVPMCIIVRSTTTHIIDKHIGTTQRSQGKTIKEAEPKQETLEGDQHSTQNRQFEIEKQQRKN